MPVKSVSSLYRSVGLEGLPVSRILGRGIPKPAAASGQNVSKEKCLLNSSKHNDERLCFPS